MRLVGWLYWRIYETGFNPLDFQKRFEQDFDTVYGKYFGLLRILGFLQDSGERVFLTDRLNPMDIGILDPGAPCRKS